MKRVTIKEVQKHLKFWNDTKNYNINIWFFYNQENGDVCVDTTVSNETLYNLKDNIEVYSYTFDNYYIYSNNRLYKESKKILDEFYRDI